MIYRRAIFSSYSSSSSTSSSSACSLLDRRIASIRHQCSVSTTPTSSSRLLTVVKKGGGHCCYVNYNYKKYHHGTYHNVIRLFSTNPTGATKKEEDNNNNKTKEENTTKITRSSSIVVEEDATTGTTSEHHDKKERGPSAKQPLTFTAKSTPNHSNSNSSILPGIGLSAMTALGGFQMASAISEASGIPMSGIPCAILLGMGIQNLVLVRIRNDHVDSTSSSSSSVSALLQPGITYSTKTILQGGIVCVAAKLSFLDLVSAGSTGIPVVLSSVGAGLLFLPLAGRVAGLPSQMSLLLGAGTSICGVTAITALAPAIQAPPRDVAVAVANTVVFGTVGMICYPYLFHSLCHGGSEHVGMCLGVAIHDTSQVLGAALSYKETFGDEVAFQVAAVTKLMRNLGLAFAIPALTYVHASSVVAKNAAGCDGNVMNGLKKGDDATGTKMATKTTTATTTTTISGLNTFSKYIPPFLYAFLAMSMARTGGDYLLQDNDVVLKEFRNVMDLLGNDASKYALGTAMAGVGLSTNAASLRGVGWKPFAVGGAGALVVGGTGYTVASLLM